MALFQNTDNADSVPENPCAGLHVRRDSATGSKYPPVVRPRLRTWLGLDLACDTRCLAIKGTDSRHSCVPVLFCCTADRRTYNVSTCYPPPPPPGNICNTKICRHSNDYTHATTTTSSHTQTTVAIRPPSLYLPLLLQQAYILMIQMTERHPHCNSLKINTLLKYRRRKNVLNAVFVLRLRITKCARYASLLWQLVNTCL